MMESRGRAQLRLDILCLRTTIVNYSEAELNAKNSSETNSMLRSWARDVWRIGSNVLLRSDPNQYSFQFLQLFSLYGNGWIPVKLSDFPGQGSLWRSLCVLDSHGLILRDGDMEQDQIKIQGVNLKKEIREKLNCQLDKDIIEDFFNLLNTSSSSEGEISRSTHIGLTSTVRLALCHPDMRLSPGFEACWDHWISGLSAYPTHALNHEEKWVMSVGIEFYEGLGSTRSLHFKSLEIIFLLRSLIRSRLRYDAEGAEARAKAKDSLDPIMRLGRAYMTFVETIIPHPDPQVQAYVLHSLYEITRDCAGVCDSLRELASTLGTILILTPPLPSPLTPHIPALLEQLTTFFMAGWNSWKHLENTHQNRGNPCGENLGNVCLTGILNCICAQGKIDEILTFVKETREYLSQLPREYQFKAFFPELVMHYVLAFGPEGGDQKKSLLLDLETYLMGIYRGHQDNSTQCPPPGYDTYLSQGVFPHLFNCLAQLGRYQRLHGIVTELGSVLETWTDTTLNRIELYVHLPSALAASVKYMDFELKEALMRETLMLGGRLVLMSLFSGAYENIRKPSIDPMEGLINYCFETGMVQALTTFMEILQVVLLKEYGENRIGPITTTIIHFGQSVANGLVQMSRVKVKNSGWTEFLEQVKSCLVKWTQLISTPQHAHEKLEWMDAIAGNISRHINLYLD